MRDTFSREASAGAAAAMMPPGASPAWLRDCPDGGRYANRPSAIIAYHGAGQGISTTVKQMEAHAQPPSALAAIEAELREHMAAVGWSH